MTTNSDGTGTVYANKASVNNLTTTNNGTVTWYAKWGKSYTLTLDPNGGKINGSMNEIYVYGVEGETYTVPNATGETYTITYMSNGQGATYTASPTTASLDFSGWSLSGKGSLDGNVYTFGAGNATLVARYGGNSYPVEVPSLDCHNAQTQEQY